MHCNLDHHTVKTWQAIRIMMVEQKELKDWLAAEAIAHREAALKAQQEAICAQQAALNAQQARPPSLLAPAYRSTDLSS
jgi:hypothetical protein